MVQKINLDINKLDWLAIARVMAPILAPIILSVIWIVLARNNKTVDWLSNVFALAEITPAIDLNLPSGVVLGSFYNSAKEIEPAVKQVVEFVKDLKEDVAEVEIGLEKDVEKLKKDPLQTLWDWFTFDIRKTEEFKERQRQ
jgi:hypothetical protein